MNNPWKNFTKQAPFIADIDKEFVESYNRNVPQNSNYKQGLCLRHLMADWMRHVSFSCL